MLSIYAIVLALLAVHTDCQTYKAVSNSCTRLNAADATLEQVRSEEFNVHWWSRPNTSCAEVEIDRMWISGRIFYRERYDTSANAPRVNVPRRRLLDNPSRKGEFEHFAILDDGSVADNPSYVSVIVAFNSYRDAIAVATCPAVDGDVAVEGFVGIDDSDGGNVVPGLKTQLQEAVGPALTLYPVTLTCD